MKTNLAGQKGKAGQMRGKCPRANGAKGIYTYMPCLPRPGLPLDVRNESPQPTASMRLEIHDPRPPTSSWRNVTIHWHDADQPRRRTCQWSVVERRFAKRQHLATVPVAVVDEAARQLRRLYVTPSTF
jgi:hypothetical protein